MPRVTYTLVASFPQGLIIGALGYRHSTYHSLLSSTLHYHFSSTFTSALLTPFTLKELV
jgi:hypothetical protein